MLGQQKFLSVVIVGLVATGLHLAALELKENSLNEVDQLSQLWWTDWANLGSLNEMEPLLHDISRISIEAPPADKVAQLWAQYGHVPISINPAGHSRAEILIVSSMENGEMSATIITSIYSLTSGNLLSEISRRYILAPTDF